MQFSQSTPPPIAPMSHVHHRRRWVAIVFLLVLVFVAFLCYILIKKPPFLSRKETPAETLKRLDESSFDANASAQARASELQGLTKTSTPNTQTREDRLNELQSLHK